MKKMIGFITMFMMFGINFATAGPIDWTMEKFGYKPEISIVKAEAAKEVAEARSRIVATELVAAQREIEVVSNFNNKLSAMITTANTYAIGSSVGFGAMFMLVLWMSSTVIKNALRSVKEWRETRRQMKAERKLKSVPLQQTGTNG